MAGAPLRWKLNVRDVGELSEWMEGMAQPAEPSVTLLDLDGKAPRNILTAQEIKQAQAVLQSMDGSEVKFEVKSVMKHENMIVAEVDVPEDVPCGTDMPHLILWHSPKVKPTFAYELLRDPESCIDSMCYDPPLNLLGIVGLETQSGDPAFHEGKFLKVETLPRANRQAEPKGHATFLQEEQADAWKAKLAASVKNDAPGPEILKLKANVQQAGKPGHLYLRWGASAGDMTARELGEILEERLQELMK